MYVKEEYAAGLEILSQGCNRTVEWICLYLPKIHSILVNVYRPPTCQEVPFSEALTSISCGMDSLNPPMQTVLICGDFNLPVIEWQLGTVNGGTVSMRKQAETLVEFMGKYNL